MRYFLTIVLVLLLIGNAISQNIWLHPNKGQWDDEIKYAVDLKNGYMYVDSKGFTYFLHNAMQHEHDHHHQGGQAKDIQAQVITSHFLNSSWGGTVQEENPSSFYRNYYLGNDSGKWRSTVYSIARTTMTDFYPGIDMVLDGQDAKFKYSFIVKPGMDASKIAYLIDGADEIYLEEGSLHVVNRFGEIIEEKPIAWTEKDGRKKKVEVEFVVNGSEVAFNFPEGYDNTETLIIDPYLVFSTFSGSTMDNWGMTATPDPDGNLYAGGIVFGITGVYPTTPGSFDMTYNGGSSYQYIFGSSTYNMSGFDVALSKFNANGTLMVYSTYLGGSDNDAPHSLVTDENGDLYVLGVTGSINFPTVAGSYDITHNGGPFVAENELGYNGADMYVTRFNPAGNALVGSTFVGGSGTDGINIDDLNYNYGDPFRGEIIVKDGFVYVSSTSRSTNFPTIGAAQSTLNGLQDAVIFKMNDALNTMSWSTYFGGVGLETGNSLQLSSTGNVFVAGGSNSGSLPFASGEDLTFNGGVSDGYLLRIQGASSTFLSGTFMGFNEYDQAYFVQLDLDDNVYVYGQSETAWPLTAGVYGNPNSGQFIRKYNNSLSAVLWTTMIGAGSGNPEISPTAFLVSDCYDIYISGWGGTINSAYSNQAQFSSSSGFPVTFDAYQSSTNGSNFYIAVLGQNASILKYATYMGGTTSSYNHVDGGTSRFDKSGRIYHAVCGACGGNDFGFTSTPGVWSPTNQSTNCNLAAFKFELSTIEAIVSEPQTLICLPDPVVFSNNSANGNSFFWDFGDGITSTDVNPSHMYADPGDYTVTLVVSDSNGCFTPDSVDFLVQIGDFQGGAIQPGTPVCPGTPYQLEAYGGAEYEWSPANVLDDPLSATPVAIVYQTTEFTVVISDSCGVDTIVVIVPVFQNSPTVSNDTSVCIGNSAFLQATGGGTYSWTPATFLSDPSIANPVSTPNVTTEYVVEIISVDGCLSEDSVTVAVFYDPPIPVMPDTVVMCRGSSAVINVSGGDSYQWSPNYFINTLIGPSVVVNPPDDYLYFCNFFNACGYAIDSVYLNVLEAQVNAGNDTSICPGGSANIWAEGALSYVWSPANSLNISNGTSVIATPDSETVYTVIGTDVNGCTDSAAVLVSIYPQPWIVTSPDVYAIYGDVIQLSANSSTPGPYVWSPAEYVSCITCLTPTVSPNQNMTFTVTFSDINGCTAADSVSVYYDPIIYVPNTFTPDDNEFNQGFRVVASNIRSFELLIFNRWGELIYTLNDLSDYWDGSYNGFVCQDGTYVWKLTYYDFKDKKYTLTGHVNLLR